MDELTFKIKDITLSPDFGEFAIEPLEPGFGHTIGNALRRVLYTSIQGAAITSVRINGVKHKFSTLAGLKENIVDLLLNIKELNLRLPENKDSATIKLSVKGAKTVTANDLELSDGVEILNKDQYIGSLSGDKAKLELEITIEKGYGFSLAEERKSESLGIVTVDAVFSPIRRVTYAVSATRVGRRTDLDKLTLKIWTNGTVNPKEALQKAAKILTHSFKQIYDPNESEVVTETATVTSGIPANVLKMTID